MQEVSRETAYWWKKCWTVLSKYKEPMVICSPTLFAALYPGVDSAAEKNFWDTEEKIKICVDPFLEEDKEGDDRFTFQVTEAVDEG